jgi:hypothetical protein
LLSKNIRIKIHRSIVLPIVLYGCGTWFFRSRKEYRLRFIENRLRRKIFGTKEDEEIGAWRRIHKEELHEFFSLPNIIRMIKSRRLKWAGHVARMWERRNTCRILVGKFDGKRPRGIPRCR